MEGQSLAAFRDKAISCHCLPRCWLLVAVHQLAKAEIASHRFHCSHIDWPCMYIQIYWIYEDDVKHTKPVGYNLHKIKLPLRPLKRMHLTPSYLFFSQTPFQSSYLRPQLISFQFNCGFHKYQMYCECLPLCRHNLAVTCMS